MRLFTEIGVFSPLLLLVAVAGCGSPPASERVAVSGTVTLDGAPLPYGAILLVGAQGPKAGGVIRDGKFAVAQEEGPAPGEIQVQIRAPRLPPGAQLPADQGEVFRLVMEAEELLPSHYNTDSQLRAEVTVEGPNQLEFQLESPEE